MIAVYSYTEDKRIEGHASSQLASKQAYSIKRHEETEK